MFNEEEDIVELSDKEEEIMEYYTDEYEEYSDESEEIESEEDDELEDDDETEKYEEFRENGILEENRISKRIRNILIAIVIFIAFLVIIDIVAVTKFDKGPFFAIPVKKYNDGGTKEYFGLGYKVIQYHQVQGRRDKELGFWTLNYNTTALTIKDKELAMAYIDNPIDSYRKYHNKFVRIISTLKDVEPSKSKITMEYIDDNGKYSMNIVCDIVYDQINISAFEKGKKITIIGTLREYRTKGNTRNLHVSYCFAEQ